MSSIVLPVIRHPYFIFDVFCKYVKVSGAFISITTSDKLSNKEGRKFQCIIDGTRTVFDIYDCPSLGYGDIVNNRRFYEGVKVAFILQYRYSNLDEYDKIFHELGIRIVPWIYPPMKNFQLGKFQWKNTSHKYVANMAFNISKTKWRRLDWLNIVKDNPKFCKARTGEEALSQNQAYYNLLQETCWGISLRGSVKPRRNGVMDGKCTREPEFMSCSMPLAYNYMPTYPFPFVPDEDYVFLRQPADLLNLDKYDAEKFHEKSMAAWSKYFSPHSSMNLLRKLVFDKTYRDGIPSFWGHFKTRQTEYLMT